MNPQTKAYKENMVWAKEIRAQGYTIVDIGDVPGRDRSPFYEMEQSILYDPK